MSEPLPDFMAGMVKSEVDDELRRLGKFLQVWMEINGLRHGTSGLLEVRDPLAQAINAVVSGIEPPAEMVEKATNRVQLAHYDAVRQAIDEAKEIAGDDAS